MARRSVVADLGGDPAPFFPSGVQGRHSRRPSENLSLSHKVRAGLGGVSEFPGEVGGDQPWPKSLVSGVLALEIRMEPHKEHANFSMDV